MSAHAAAASAVADAARRLAAEGLLIGTAGNVSLRVPGTDDVAVTGSGVVLADCAPADICVVDAAGAVKLGSVRPSSELGLHLGVYADRDVAAVVHTHAPWSTAVACVLDELPVLHYQQLLLGGAIRVAPYATFGSAELASGVRHALVDRQAALMAGHGVVDGRRHARRRRSRTRCCSSGSPRSTTGHPPSARRARSPSRSRTTSIAAVLDRGYGQPQEDHA